MTEPTRRFSSEAASHIQSPVGSLRQGTSPPRSPYLPDRRRLSSNSQGRPASVLDQASASTHQRQQRPQDLQLPSQESLLLQQNQQQQQQPQPTSPPPPPAPPLFTPVFALVDDATGRLTTHHPRVHYIFSDDDPEDLTAALDDAAADHPHPSTSSGGAPAAISSAQSRDRAIVVDLVPSPDGKPGSFSVASAVSLSPEWAVTSAQVSGMQTGGNGGDVPGRKGKARDSGDAGGDGNDDNDDQGGRGLMLRIEGVGIDKGAAAAAAVADHPLTLSGSSSGGSRHSERRKQQQQQQGPGPNGAEEFVALADDFDRRMGTLRRVVDASIPGLHSEQQRSAHGGGDDAASPSGPSAAEADAA